MVGGYPLQLLDLGDDEGLGGRGGGDGEGPKEVGEEGGVEVAEPEEGDLKRGVPWLWGEELGGGGEVEAVIVDLEVERRAELREDRRSENNIRAPPEMTIGESPKKREKDRQRLGRVDLDFIFALPFVGVEV
ncbi:uncharacterized protein A4U43_C02F18760 [Asparagus officinalis]|uniref:Uncharacterized protein n=1 Tax=Asparagus officinalis TaxID=4686 RepID=A0A5P1FJH3_ASPOF|nr:uncharacterized protein A4U43_C02F18760 [Asparagus officinalis]